MIQLKDKKDCCGCYSCASVCPQSCIRMEEDNEGFRYPVIDENLCSECGLCGAVCPVINRFPKPAYDPKVFACYNKNEQIRLDSSSGGLFSLLAENTIQQNGIVFGARFDKDFSVIHDFTQNIEGLDVFRGSKYVHSLVRDNYGKAEQFLRQGKQVMFTGTPCQIAGLKHYLQRDYENLLAVDIVCHGVPSPKVFRKYLEELDSSQDGRIEKMQFRDKTEGWKKCSFAIKRKDGKISVLFREPLTKNIFMRGFLQNLYLRPSCHDCPSKAFTSGSDITIADYWGIQQKHPDFDDDKGCSLVICNNPKGHQIFLLIINEMNFIESSLKNALLGNHCIINSVPPHPNRKLFFKHMEDKSIIRLIKHLSSPTVKECVKQFVYNALLKIKQSYYVKTFSLRSNINKIF